MIANELRVGNVLYWRYSDMNVFVTAIQEEGITDEWEQNIVLNDLDPISLTEEWLIKLGFKNPYSPDVYYLELGSPEFIIFIDSTERGFAIFDKIDDELISILIKFDYVHEVQNLYYSLTKTELTINLDKL